MNGKTNDKHKTTGKPLLLFKNRRGVKIGFFPYALFFLVDKRPVVFIYESTMTYKFGNRFTYYYSSNITLKSLAISRVTEWCFSVEEASSRESIP